MKTFGMLLLKIMIVLITSYPILVIIKISSQEKA